MATETCADCGKSFEYEPCIIGDRELFHPIFCDACCRAREAQQTAAEQKARVDMRNTQWTRICPALYRETDHARLPAEFRSAIAAWKYGPKGVGFFGPAGRCKTRSAFEILKAQHFAGRSCAAVSATRFSMEAADQFAESPDRRFEARRRLEEFRRVRVLLIDDLGKGRMTERAELELYAVLEERTSGLLPTIWTANATSAQLKAMMSADRREPIIRRLREFSDIIGVGSSEEDRQ